MPKKSDRPNHESTMSRLLPDVSLEEEENDTDSSSTELQNSRTTEEENSSSREQAQIKNQSASESRRPKRDTPQSESHESRASQEEMISRQQKLQVTPNKRPDLANKLGPYVSEEVDQALEEVYLILRREFGGKASKSLIVEAALRYSLSDCLRRENDSELSRWLERVLERS